MSIRSLKALAAIGALVVTVGTAAAEPQQGQRVDVKEYDVYVDLPTAFAFIKLPTGWKFIGKLDTDQLRHLPPETLTSLLTSESAPIRLATGEARAPRLPR